MKQFIYLDNSSTTKPCSAALQEINSALCENWGNPSSLYDKGFEAQMAVESTRAAVAKLICCRDDEVYFTASGTESNNMAIIGAANARKKRGNRIVTTAIEHPSVLQTVKRLEEDGFEVVRILPQANGTVSCEDIKNAINDKTVLVSIMLVNNETGAIQPVRAAAEAIKVSGAPALLHCDAVQGFGKMPINVSSLGVDMLSASAHKIHGAKGIGILYVKKGTNIKPLITGGGQEKGLRSGTESVPLICGLKGAISELPDINRQLAESRKLWDYAEKRLCDTGIVKINSSKDALPFVLNISVEGYRSETMLHFLEAEGIYVSSGSACAKGEGSYVLSAMGLSKSRVDSALRISFSRFNTKQEIDVFCDALVRASQKIRRAN